VTGPVSGRRGPVDRREPGPPGVLLAVTGEDFEEPLLAALTRPGSRLHVLRRCLDLADLLAAASTGLAQVAVVSPALRRLDLEAVAALDRSGLRVVAVVEATDQPAAERMVGIGVGATVPLTRLAGGQPDGRALVSGLVAAVRADPDEHPPPPRPTPGRGPVGGGRLVAVWGPVGGPGRSTVAIGVADELARAGVATLLADADTYGPSLAQMLGILDEASGLAAAARAANAGTLDVAALAACARSLPTGLRVLTGITRADRWPELPASAVGEVWRVARALVQLVVVDSGFCLEEDEDLVHDTAAPRRNGAALATLAVADEVVVVGAADPVGVARLVAGLHELRAARAPGHVLVVLTRVRRGPLGRAPARWLRETVSRHAEVDRVVLVPDDGPAYDAALYAGHSLAEACPRSPARLVLRDLASDIASRVVVPAGKASEAGRSPT
jgi:MinD-like ATPase involved in chromosome partitioning or flagellar assembly